MNAAAARAIRTGSSYWEQFFSALSCSTPDQAEAWIEAEVERYQREFRMPAGIAWRTIACNLAFFSGYYGASVVRMMRESFQIFPECFDVPDFRQDKRSSMNGSGKPAASSPV
jgi:hypothetical protein